jgi:beta-aspartyl-peptidase (threonine type)
VKIPSLLRLLAVLLTGCLAPQTLADSTPANDTASPGSQIQATQSDDYQGIYALVLKMVDAWNAHDLDGYLSVFWNSPDLVVIVEGEQAKGWAELSANYHRGFTDLTQMGSVITDRVQIQTVSPGIALVVDWWTLVFTTRKISGTSTFVVRNLPEGWRIVAGHTTILAS